MRIRFSSAAPRVTGLGAALAVVALIAGAAPALSQTSTPPAGDKITALVVIDVQEFYFPGGALPLDRPEAAAANCKKLLEKFRSEKKLVVHVGHKAKTGVAFHADVVPLEGEKVVMKEEVSAFNGTDLLEYLRAQRVEKLVICGMQTHMCVEGAVRAAYDLGFECTVVRDACATRALAYGEKTVAAEDVHAATLATLDRYYGKVTDTESVIKGQ
ncbi:MAG: cysteine hydrolase [Candidatus Krumholzibacteriota bacterium]|nr:cysteine hydrolase [Candidatus Krumholzibacteriota bacterium]